MKTEGGGGSTETRCCYGTFAMVTIKLILISLIKLKLINKPPLLCPLVSRKLMNQHSTPQQPGRLCLMRSRLHNPQLTTAVLPERTHIRHCAQSHRAYIYSTGQTTYYTHMFVSAAFTFLNKSNHLFNVLHYCIYFVCTGLFRLGYPLLVFCAVPPVSRCRASSK